ncbi:LuxR C-terminal-related transcriptional regulator [Lentzea sp. NPDC042327]|uniref:LuxR C-terminal-related transcriptional regulator n=1 Tax=Lentzea sp. NPDC042327 TaxID=3154801 RepID=UPI0033F4AF7B
MGVTRVVVCCADFIARTGVVISLRSFPEVEVREEAALAAAAARQGADVVVAVADRLSVDVAAALRQLRQLLDRPVVLVVREVEQVDVVLAVDCNVVAVLPAAEFTADRLHTAVLTAARGGAVLPFALAGDLVRHVRRVHAELLDPHGLRASGLKPREVEVIELMADGHDTAEIAAKLSASERSVKKLIHNVTSRLNLRNRPHAVAYALRHGVI